MAKSKKEPEATDDPWDAVNEHEKEHGAPEEQEGGDLPKLPAGVWFLGRTINEEGNGWAPGTQGRATNDNTRYYWQFRFGLALLGCETTKEGEFKADPKRFQNMYCSAQFFIHPNPEKSTDLIQGRLVGLFNAMFAKNVGDDLLPTADMKKADKEALTKKRTAARWDATKALLKEAGDAAGITAKDYSVMVKLDPDHDDYDPENEWVEVGDRDLARYMVACAHASLMGETRTVLFKTKKEEYTNKDGEKIVDVRVGTVQDDTARTRAKRNIKLWGDESDAVDDSVPF